MLNTLKRNAAVVAVATMVCGAGAYAWAAESPTRPASDAASAATSSPTDAGGHARGRKHGGDYGMLRRATHGDLVVKGKSQAYENVTFDRGEVTAAGAASITVHRPDGPSVTKAIDASTKFKGIGSAADIQMNKPAVVVSKGAVAVAVFQRLDSSPPPSGAPSGPGNN